MSVVAYYTDACENGFTDVASLYEYLAADWDDGERHDITVQEWSTKPVRQHVNTGNRIDRIVEDIVEYDLEEAGDEYGHLAEKMDERSKDPAVRAAFAAAIDLLFKGVSWWVADKVVATHRITHDDNGEPLFDGKPLYVKRATSE